MNEARGPSAMETLRRYRLAAAVAISGSLASATAAGVGWRMFIILATLVATAAVARRSSRRHPTETAVDRAARIGIDVLAERLGRGLVTIGQRSPRVSINRRLIADFGLSAADMDLDDEAVLARLLGCFKTPDAFRADMAQLRHEPDTSIHREIDLADGRVFALHATSLHAESTPQHERQRSYFFFTEISAQATIARDLQFANTLMQTQLDASPLGMLVVDDAGTITASNRRFREIADVPAVGAAADTKDPEAFLTRARRLHAHPEGGGRDEIVMGDDRVLQRYSVPLTAASGQSFGRVWFFADITDVRMSERRAHEERDFVRAILDSLPGYFVLIDSAGRLVRWNESLRLLNGLDDEQLLGADPFANVVEEDRAEIRSQLGRTIANGASDLEFRIHSSRGVRRLRWHGRRIVIDGQPHALAIGTDLTDVYAAEALRREDEKRFRDIFESATEGILIEDTATGAYLDANPQLCAMFGYPLEEFLTLDPLRISVASPADVRARRDAVLRTSSSGSETFEQLCRAKDGREFWCEFSARRIANFTGRDVVLMMVRDITERRAAREAIAYRDRILHALTVSTADLVKAPSLAGAMAALLKAVGEELHIDRLLVISRDDSDDMTDASIRYGWQRDGSPTFAFTTTPSMSAATKAAIDAWLAPLLRGLPVMTYTSEATGTVRAVLLGAGVVSSLLVPIFVGGRCWGYFAVDDTRAIRDWSAIEIDALKTLADVVGSLVARDRSATALLQSEEQFRTVSDSVFDAIIMIGTDGSVRYWNRAAERIFGYSATEIVGKPIHQVLAPGRIRNQAEELTARFIAAVDEPPLGTTVELAAVRKDGVEIDVEFSVNPMSMGTARFAVAIARDITARNKAAAAIGHMATHDLLTELPNRRFFIEALNAVIDRSKRSGHPFAALYLDLDQFKDVNDTLGHPVGDRLLQAVAARLSANVRGIDTVARFGGDEFAAIQTDIREPADAAALADKIVHVLAEPFEIDGQEIRSAASIGIAVYGPESPDAEALLAHADVALYRAKADGRGVYRFYTDSMDAAVRERVTLERELRDALTRDQFFLAYQPLVDLTDRRIAGFEALTRWRHPTRGILEPHEFIPTAEKSGLIVAEGAWAFRETCEHVRSWLDAGLVPPIVGIRISLLQFKASSDLERSIVAALEAFDVSAARFVLQLAESVMMQATQRYTDVLLRLQAMGFGIAIDDFGTGHSSLDNLRRFHVDRITMPEIFIRDVGRDSGTAPVVRATISLARELGITVAAKGVDTAAQIALMESFGCRLVQGTYFSAPLSADAARMALHAGLPFSG